MIVEALEPEQLALGAVHGTENLQAHALVGMAPAVPSLAVGCAPVDVAILKGEADLSTRDLRGADVHGCPPPHTRGCALDSLSSLSPPLARRCQGQRRRGLAE